MKNKTEYRWKYIIHFGVLAGLLFILLPATILAYDESYYEINRLDSAVYLDFEMQRFTNGKGTARKTFDVSGNYLNAVENGYNTVGFPRINYDRKADFAGAGNYLHIPYNSSFDFNISDIFSVTMWINAPNSGSYAELIHSPSGGARYAFRAYLANNGYLRFCIFDGSNQACNALDYTGHFGVWSLVSLVKSENKLCMSINNQNFACQGFSGIGSTKAGSGNLYLGMHPTMANDYNGKMDDVIIFSRAITHKDVVKLYNERNSCGNTVCQANENPKTCPVDCESISPWEDKFLDSYYHFYYNAFGPNRDFNSFIYDANNYMTSLLKMYSSTGRKWYLEQAIKTAEKFIAKSKNSQVVPPHPILDSVNSLLANRDSDAGGHLELPCNRYCGMLSGYAGREEISRVYRGLTALAKIIRGNAELNGQYGVVADRIIQLAEYDVMRNPNAEFADIQSTKTFGYAAVHHFMSTYLIIRKNLFELTSKQSYKNEMNILLDKMIKTLYSGGPNGGDANAVAWGGIQCADINYVDKQCLEMKESYSVRHCQDSKGTPYCFPTDVAHSRDTVDAFIELYEDGYLGNLSNGGRDLINRLIYTTKNVIISETNGYQTVSDFIDGTSSSVINNWISPGWVNLGRYDVDLNQKFISMEGAENFSIAYKPSFYSEMLKNSLYLKSYTPSR